MFTKPPPQKENRPQKHGTCSGLLQLQLASAADGLLQFDGHQGPFARPKRSARWVKTWVQGFFSRCALYKNYKSKQMCSSSQMIPTHQSVCKIRPHGSNRFNRFSTSVHCPNHRTKTKPTQRRTALDGGSQALTWAPGALPEAGCPSQELPSCCEAVDVWNPTLTVDTLSASARAPLLVWHSPFPCNEQGVCQYV